MKWTLLIIMLFSSSLSYCDEKLKQIKIFTFGESSFQFEQPKLYNPNNPNSIIWQKLYFIKNGQKHQMYPYIEDGFITFDLIEEENISKYGTYFILTLLRYGGLDGDRQYCAIVKTTDGCILTESTNIACDGEWSQQEDNIRITNDNKYDMNSWPCNLPDE